MGLLRSTDELKNVLPLVPGSREGYAVPFQFAFTGEDGLRVAACNVSFGLRIAVTARWLADGATEVTALEWDFKPTVDGIDATIDIPLPRGVLLNLVVRPIGVFVRRGECFVRVDVIRGRAATITLGTLLMGYIGSWGGRAWPGSPLESPLDGPGFVHALVGGPPAAGAAAQLAIPAYTRWRVMSVLATLTTSAVAGVRQPYVVVTSSGADVFYSQSSRPQDASAGVSHCYAPGVMPGLALTGSFGFGGLPNPLYIDDYASGLTAFTFGAVGLLGGDQWSGITAFVEEWRDPLATFGL